MSRDDYKIKSVNDIRKFSNLLIQSGKSMSDIASMVQLKVDSNAGITVDVIKDVVEEIVSKHPNYELIQLIMNNKLIVDKDSKGDTIYLVGDGKGLITSFNRNRLQDMFKKPNFSDRTYVAKFTYNPYNFNMLYKEDKVWNFNMYQPAEWMSEYFYSSGKVPIEVVDEVPHLYNKFLMHLVDGDIPSYDYILDWTANAIKSRNFTILTTIGSQGIGKGVLGDIFQGLFGDKNYTLTDNKLINKDFNAQLKNKRLVYLDEVLVKTSSEINKFKSLINSIVEVEGKGVDAITVKNHASIYTSSNDMDAINLPGDDRRFSIVNLTDKKLKDHFSEPIESLLAPDNIAELGRYLWHREVDSKKMLDVFVSGRTDEIRAATLKSWEDYFLDVYCIKYAGKQIELNSVGSDIKEALDEHFSLGRPAFSKLQVRYPNKFKIVRPAAKPGKVRSHYIKINEIQE